MMMFDEVLKLYSGHGILQEDEAEEEWRDTIFGCNEVVALKFSRCAPRHPIHSQAPKLF